MDAPLRVTLVTHYFPAHRGGVERVAWEIASRLAASGKATISWYASDTDQPPAGVPGVSCFPAAACNIAERSLGFPYPLWSASAVLSLARAVRRGDLLHLHDFMYLPNIVACLVARIARRPVIITQHVGAIPFSNPILRLALAAANRVLGKLLLGSATQAVFVGEAVRRYFEHFVHFRRPPLRIANGVDVTTFHPAEEHRRGALRAQFNGDGSKPLLLFAGRFVEKKGMRLLEQLARSLPGVRWAFAGWGPMDPAAWQLANVSVHRNLAQEQLVPLYQAADLLVLPSVGEGFPLVVQEAMACGTPALVSAETAAGSPEAADVLLSEPLGGEDEAARWCARIEALVATGDTLATLRRHVADFARSTWSWERTVERYGEILRQAASSK